MRISDWSSDVCSSDLLRGKHRQQPGSADNGKGASCRMNRPLIITDCDEVLLHMVVPFREWLDESHDIHFDMHDRGFGEALRHKDSGQPVERALVWELLLGRSEEHASALQLLIR